MPLLAALVFEGTAWTPRAISIAEETAALLPPPATDVVLGERIARAARGDAGADADDDGLRRSVVREMVRALDAEHGWSSETAWRAIAGWHHTAAAPLGDLVAKDRGAWADDRPHARLSPAADLASYAERFLVDAPRDDAPARCDDPTRWRFLAAKIGAARWEGVRCPAFERWIRPDSVEELELLLAAPSTKRPASMWGHLLLRVRHRDGAAPTAPGLEPVFHAGVAREDEPRSLARGLRGLTGDLDAQLFLTPSHRIERRYLVEDARALRRFRLMLDADQRRRVLERFWESGRHRARWRYAFFTENCAGMLGDLISSALLPEIELGSPSGIVSPATVVDLLGPVVEWSATEPGSDERAFAADARREELEAAELGGMRGAHVADASARAVAYAEVQRTGDAARDASLARWVAASIEVESHASPSLVPDLAETYGDLLDATGESAAPLPLASTIVDPRVAVQRSGSYTARGAAGVREKKARVAIDVSVLDEVPGEHRHAGLRPDVGMRCLGLRLESGPRFEEPVWDATVFEMRSLRHELREAGRQPGWGVRIGASGDERATIAAFEGGPEAGLATGGWLDHVRVALHAGAGLSDDVPAATARAQIAARVHVGGSSLNHAGARLSARGILRDDRAGATGTTGTTLLDADAWIALGPFRPTVSVRSDRTRTRTTALLEITLPW